MRQFIWIVLITLSSVWNTAAQVFEGHITDLKGNVIEGAVVYIRETAQGCTADENGVFRIPLSSGKYSCEISCLGFEKQFVNVQVKEGMGVLTIQLKPAVYQLKEVKVSARGEDPALYIMRNAIAKAPYHRNQVSSYVSEVYTKGTARLDKVPRLLMLSTDAGKELKPMIGKLFLLESMMEIRFKAPDEYERKILAFSSTIPSNMDPGDALNIITASIYDPSVMNVVSPLAPGAFSYYRFKFVECYNEGNLTINKIRVEPRKKNAQLLDGWIYIAEDNWSVVNFDFKIRAIGVTARLKGIFHEVKPSVFLPTSYDIEANVKIFGILAGGKYYSSVKYKEVESAVEDAWTVRQDTLKEKNKSPEKKQLLQKTKAERQLEVLAAKEELTTRDAYRVARLTQQMMEPERSDTLSPLEIREMGRKEKVIVDSMAALRDSSYWSKMRTMPLKREEVSSYQRKDSLKEVMHQIFGDNDSLSSRKKSFGWGEMIMGGSYHLGKRDSWNFDGLIWAVPEYNFVDGFWIGQGFNFNFGMEKGRNLSLRPSVYFATARKKVLWELKGKYNYSPMRLGLLSWSFGEVSADYKGEMGSLRLENSVTSLVCGDNFIKFYGKQYVNIQNKIDVANGFVIRVGGNYEKRRVLRNHISYNFYKREPESNSPKSRRGWDMPDNTSLSFSVQADYTPRFFYRVRNGWKAYAYSNWPTFSIRYERGIPVGSSVCRSSYDRLDMKIWQNIDLGIFNRLDYTITAGKFFSHKQLYFPDFKHFSSSGWILSQDDFAGGFFLADYYELSTNDSWLDGALNYTSSYLLLKRLPFMQRFFFNEGVHVRYIWTPSMRNYAECGYSIGVDQLARLGVFAGFDRKGYRGTGFRLSFRF